MSGLFFRHRPHLRRWLFIGVALVLGATASTAALAGVLIGAEDSGNPVGVLAVATVLWCLFVVGGCSSLLRLVRDYEAEMQTVLDREVDAEVVEAARKLQDEASRKRRHDLANALTAIEGAAMILNEDAETLSKQDRLTLTKVLESGTGRLRRLLSQEDSDEDGRASAPVGNDPAA